MSLKPGNSVSTVACKPGIMNIPRIAVQSVQSESGEGYTPERDDLLKMLEQYSTDNLHKIDLTEAINSMKREAEIRIHADSE